MGVNWVLNFRRILFSLLYFVVVSNSYAGLVPSSSPDLLPSTLDNYANIELPPHFKTPLITGFDNTPNDNPTTDEGATLGRVLFYDKSLSIDNSISCGSCHVQKNGFSSKVQFASGVGGQESGLKTPPLDNLRYRFTFGVMQTVDKLEDQALLAITNPLEMGQPNVFVTIPILEKQPYYPRLFTNAFGDSAITEERIAKALSQFMRSMLSFNSKFDRGVAIGFSNFTAQENQGRELFESDRTKCSVCHNTVLHQNTLEEQGTGTASGMATGSLKNVNERLFFTAFSERVTLKDMLIHYNRNISRCVNFEIIPTEDGELFPFGQFFCPGGDSVLTDDGRNGIKMELTEEEEDAIISYLKTLSDPAYTVDLDVNGSLISGENSLLVDKKFSDPFFKPAEINFDSDMKVNPGVLLLMEEE